MRIDWINFNMIFHLNTCLLVHCWLFVGDHFILLLLLLMISFVIDRNCYCSTFIQAYFLQAYSVSWKICKENLLKCIMMNMILMVFCHDKRLEIQPNMCVCRVLPLANKAAILTVALALPDTMTAICCHHHQPGCHPIFHLKVQRNFVQSPWPFNGLVKHSEGIRSPSKGFKMSFLVSWRKQILALWGLYKAFRRLGKAVPSESLWAKGSSKGHQEASLTSVHWPTG